jgi:hypothetical protein
MKTYGVRSRISILSIFTRYFPGNPATRWLRVEEDIATASAKRET